MMSKAPKRNDQKIIESLRTNKIALEDSNIDLNNKENIKIDKLNLEQIDQLFQFIDDDKTINLEDKQTIKKLIELYKNFEKETSKGLLNRILKNENLLYVTKKIGQTLLWKSPDPKIDKMIDTNQDSIRLIKKYFEQILFDLHKSLLEKNTSEIKSNVQKLKNFSNTSIFEINNENGENITFNIPLMIKNIFLKENSNPSETEFHEILKILFDLSKKESFDKLLNDLQGQINDPNKKIDLIKILLDNIFDLLKDSTNVLENKKKIEKLFKFFGLNKNPDQEYIFNLLFETFSFEAKGNDQYLIIQDIKKFTEFNEKFINSAITDTDVNQISLFSNLISKQLFESNLTKGKTNNPLKIKISDNILQNLKTVIQSDFVKRSLDKNINKNNYLNENFSKNKEFISILLKITKNVRNRPELQENLINSLKSSGISSLKNLRSLIDKLNENEDLQKDFNNLFILFHNKIIDGFSKESPKTLTRHSSTDSGFSEEDTLEKEEQTKQEYLLSKDEKRDMLGSDEFNKLILDGIFKKNETSLNVINKILDLTLENQPDLKKNIFDIMDTLSYDENKGIEIKPKKLLTNLEKFIEFLKDEEERSEVAKIKKIQQFDVTIKSLKVFLSILELNKPFNNENKKIYINKENEKEFFENIIGLLKVDMVYATIIDILKNDKLTDIDKANKEIKDLEKEISNLKLTKDDEAKESNILRLKYQKLEEETYKLEENNQKEKGIIHDNYQKNLQNQENRKYLYICGGSAVSGATIFANAFFLKKYELIDNKKINIMFGISAVFLLAAVCFFAKSMTVNTKIELYNISSQENNQNQERV